MKQQTKLKCVGETVLQGPNYRFKNHIKVSKTVKHYSYYVSVKPRYDYCNHDRGFSLVQFSVFANLCLYETYIVGLLLNPHFVLFPPIPTLNHDSQPQAPLFIAPQAFHYKLKSILLLSSILFQNDIRLSSSSP